MIDHHVGNEQGTQPLTKKEDIKRLEVEGACGQACFHTQQSFPFVAMGVFKGHVEWVFLTKIHISTPDLEVTEF